MLRIAGTGRSHVGLVRRVNQDSAFIAPGCMLVADGVGGGAAGEVASATAAYAVAGTATASSAADPIDILVRGVALAQAQIAAGVVAVPDREGMATTLTALVTDGRRFALAHLGDSRGYVFRNHFLTRVTRDHTYVQGLVEEGRLSTAEAGMHPWRNLVLRTVNGTVGAEADVVALDLRAGDRVLLATDGLTDLVPDQEIELLLSRHGDDSAIETLLGLALARGGHDNITGVLATIVEGPRVRADGELLGAVGDPANVVDLAALGSADTA